MEEMDIAKKNKNNCLIMPDRFIKAVAVLGSMGAILIAILGLFGYIPGLRFLGSIRAAYIPMAPSTAISFLLLGITLILHVQHLCKGRIRFGAIIFSALVTIFGFLKCIEYFLGVEASFEEAIVVIADRLGEIPIGIMSPSTGALFFLSGVAMFLLISQVAREERTKFFGHSAGIIGSIVFVGSLVFALGYLYGQPFLYGLGKIVPMAITTAVAFIFLGIALISAAGPNCVPVSFFAGSATRNKLLRIFVPMIIFITLIQEIINKFMRSFFKIKDALLAASLITGFALFVGFIVFRVGSTIGNVIDKSREDLKKNGEMLKAANQQLQASEQQLRASNQQLRASEQQLRASNQQLRVNEQQLRASNQQLRAGEQQLRAEISERKKMGKEREKHLHDLEVFYKANIGREERVVELKKRIKELEEKLGKKTG